MLDCRDLDFSPDLADSRIRDAEAVFGEALLRRMTVFMLFVLGLKRSHITKAMGVPPGTIRTLVRRVMGTGLRGFVDHRGGDGPTRPTPVLPPTAPALVLHLAPDADTLTVLGGDLHLPAANGVQRKVVLLSLMGEGMLGTEDVARALNMSVSHVRRLHRKLFASGVEAVLDKRCGQLQDYRVTPELKGEMIAEFVLELAGSGRASSVAVARRLAEHGVGTVSERTIRHHLERMGMNRVRTSLTAGLQAIKKGSVP